MRWLRGGEQGGAHQQISFKPALQQHVKEQCPPNQPAVSPGASNEESPGAVGKMRRQRQLPGRSQHTALSAPGQCRKPPEQENEATACPQPSARGLSSSWDPADGRGVVTVTVQWQCPPSRRDPFCMCAVHGQVTRGCGRGRGRFAPVPRSTGAAGGSSPAACKHLFWVFAVPAAVGITHRGAPIGARCRTRMGFGTPESTGRPSCFLSFPCRVPRALACRCRSFWGDTNRSPCPEGTSHPWRSGA